MASTEECIIDQGRFNVNGRLDHFGRTGSGPSGPVRHCPTRLEEPHTIELIEAHERLRIALWAIVKDQANKIESLQASLAALQSQLDTFLAQKAEEQKKAEEARLLADRPHWRGSDPMSLA